jgi:group I intron endonuclease
MSYIGFTSKTIMERWKKHLYDCRGRRYHLHHAILTYGAENFKIELIEQHKDLEYTLKTLEPKYISEHNTLTPFGYNMTPGGEGVIGHIWTEQERINKSKQQKEICQMIGWRKNRSEKQKDTWQTPEYRNKRTEVMAGVYSDPEYRRKHKENSKKMWANPKWRKEQMDLRKSQKYLDATLRSIYEVTFPTGNIQCVRNLRQFCLSHNLNPGHLYSVVSGKRKSHFGYKARQISKIELE